LLTVCGFTAAEAADSFWNNTAGGNFTNPANWSAGVPLAGDNANFTSNASYQVDWTSSITNANAFFNPTGGTVTQAIGSSFWWVTDSYIVGQNSCAAGSVVLTSGTLIVTNASGTSQLRICDSGVGTFTQTCGMVT